MMFVIPDKAGIQLLHLQPAPTVWEMDPHLRGDDGGKR